MSGYKPQVGDRVRVVLEGKVSFAPRDSEFDLEGPNGYGFHDSYPEVVSIEKIEPAPVLPDGLTISEDGSVLNWLGENYVHQPVEQPVEIFGPGDVVRTQFGSLYTIGTDGYLSHQTHTFVPWDDAVGPTYFTSKLHKRVTLS